MSAVHARHLSARAAAPFITCVMPAFNEALNLPVILPLLAQTLATLSPRHEIIVVDDGSRDDTETVMAALLAQWPVVYVQLSRNFGKEAALSAGLDFAQGDVVFNIDADMQHPLELLAPMLARWREGLDMVYAVRETRKDEAWLKQIVGKVYYRLLNLGSDFVIPPQAGDFRLMDRCVVDALLRLPERTRFMKGLYAWVGFKSEAMHYMPSERLQGSSSFNISRLFSLALDGFTTFTTLPLKIINLAGWVLSLFAMSYATYLVADYLINGNDAPGWSTIVTAILFFSGVMLIAIGTMSLYIGRIFDEVKQRPLYIVRRLERPQAALSQAVPPHPETRDPVPKIRE